jgi:hypothetical protein
LQRYTASVAYTARRAIYQRRGEENFIQKEKLGQGRCQNGLNEFSSLFFYQTISYSLKIVKKIL